MQRKTVNLANIGIGTYVIVVYFEYKLGRAMRDREDDVMKKREDERYQQKLLKEEVNRNLAWLYKKRVVCWAVWMRIWRVVFH